MPENYKGALFEDAADLVSKVIGGRSNLILEVPDMSQSNRPATSASLVTQDDRRHKLDNSDLARESLFFEVSLPEEHLGILAYTWVDAAHKAGSIGLVFGEDDERLGQFSVQGLDVSPAADFDSWEVGPLTIQHEEAHKTAHVAFEHDEVSVDFHFEATTPAFSYRDNIGGCPSFFADNRLEQSGSVSGLLKIGQRSITFNATGHRDHSWGSRDWTAFHHYKWVCIQAGSSIGINFTQALALDRLYQWGYVDRDGEQSPIVSIQAEVDRDAEFYAYTSAEFILLDELGRTTAVNAGKRSSLVTYPAGGLLLLDALGDCTVADNEGVIYFQEGWDPQFIERRKALAPDNKDSIKAKEFLRANKDVGAIAN